MFNVIGVVQSITSSDSLKDIFKAFIVEEVCFLQKNFKKEITNNFNIFSKKISKKN